MYIGVLRQVVTEKVRLTDEAALDDQTTEDGDLFQWFKHQAAQGVVSAQVCNQTAQGVIIAHRYVTWRHRASSAQMTPPQSPAGSIRSLANMNAMASPKTGTLKIFT